MLVEVGAQSFLGAAPRAAAVSCPDPAVHQRAELHQCDVVVVKVLRRLLPRSDARPPSMAECEAQVLPQQKRDFLILWTAGAQVAQAGQRAERGAIILRTRPAQNVDGPIRVETRLAKNLVSDERADLGVLPQEPACGVGGRVTISGLTMELCTIEPAERQAEAYEIVEVSTPVLPLELAARVFHQLGSRSHDDRAVADPVKEVVGLRIPVGDHRRCQHGPRCWYYDLSEGVASANQMRRGDCPRHGCGTDGGLLCNPALKRRRVV